MIFLPGAFVAVSSTRFLLYKADLNDDLGGVQNERYASYRQVSQPRFVLLRRDSHPLDGLDDLVDHCIPVQDQDPWRQFPQAEQRG